MRLSLVPFIVESIVQPNLDVLDGTLNGEYSHAYGGMGVNVYVLDTGVDFTHPIFSRAATRTGPDFTGGGNAADQNGHGTHVAGIVTQVAPKATLVSAKVFSEDGSGYVEWLLSAIEWMDRDCARTRPRGGCVASFSGVTLLANSDLDAAVTRSPIPFIAAAGNWGTDACRYSPGNASTMLVGATDSDLAFWPYSDVGSCISVFAPGVGVLSSWLGHGWAVLTGTSMAAPHVSGVAAQMKTERPHLTKTALAAALLRAARHGVTGLPPNFTTTDLFIEVPRQAKKRRSPSKIPG